MKRIYLLSIAFALCTGAFAQVNYDEWFDDATLRLDYNFTGDSDHAAIYLEELATTDGWAGRRHHLDELFQNGNGQITVRDHETGDTIYMNSFSTLFQEWLTTDEATKVSKSFESTYLVPFPKKPVDVTVTLTDNRLQPMASLTHTFDPKDILIRRVPDATAEHRYTHHGGAPEDCVDIVILAEGYTLDEMDKFYDDAQRATDAFFTHEPFRSMADRFNVLALGTVSAQSGTSVPREGLWVDTAHRSHYDTFYSDRYLTTQAIHNIYDSIAQLPVEHIILLVNTPRYGGGGIYNQVTISSASHPTFKQVLVHEFGHAYAGLADEYYYADESDGTYPVDVEPWEKNITTMVDFGSKWADLVPEGTLIPTPVADVPDLKTLDPANPADEEILRKVTQTVGVFEGAGYKPKGIYRPAQECRMKVNEGDYFCPVCYRTIVDITNWYTSK